MPTGFPMVERGKVVGKPFPGPPVDLGAISGLSTGIGQKLSSNLNSKDRAAVLALGHSASATNDVAALAPQAALPPTMVSPTAGSVSQYEAIGLKIEQAKKNLDLFKFIKNQKGIDETTALIVELAQKRQDLINSN